MMIAMKNWKYSFGGLVPFLLLFALSMSHVQAQMTSEELLVKLQEIDASFESLKLNHVVTTTLIDEGFPAWKFDNFLQFDSSRESTETREIPVEYNSFFAKLGDEAVFERESFTDAIVDRDAIDYQIWSMDRFGVRELIGTEDPVLDIWAPLTGVSTIVKRQCLGVQLVHGYGIGKMTKISSMTEVLEGDSIVGWDITGSLSLGSDAPDVQVEAQVTTGLFLVRTARLTNFGTDSLLEMVTTSSAASATLDGPAVSSEGSLVTSIQSSNLSVEIDSWSSRFVGFSELNEDEFAAYVRIRLPRRLGARVIDRFTGHTARKLCAGDSAADEQEEVAAKAGGFTKRMLDFLPASDDICGAYSCCIDCICCGPGTYWNGNLCLPETEDSVPASCDTLASVEEHGCVAEAACIGAECCGEGTSSVVDPSRPPQACYCISDGGAMTEPPSPTRGPAPTDSPTESPTGSPTGSPTLMPNNLSFGCNDGCEESWITQQDIIGGLECQHGPEHDQSAECAAALQGGLSNLRCKETDDGPGNKCECFKCQGVPFENPYSLQCEGEIRIHTAWCGLENGNFIGQCGSEQTNEYGPIRLSRAAQTLRGEACDGANGNFQKEVFCGPPDNGPEGAALACKATNCAGVGAFVIVQRGFRSRCTQ